MEIQNTYLESLQKNIFMKNYFKVKNQKFDINSIFIDQNVEKHMQRCLRYLQGLKRGKKSESDKITLDYGLEYKNGKKKL